MKTNSVTQQSDAPSRATIEEAVISAVANTLRLPPEQILPTSRLEEDLGLDSMALIHVNIGVEERLGGALSICDSPERQLRIVEDLVKLVEESLYQSRQEVRS
jgi:acyl carrier protein